MYLLLGLQVQGFSGPFPVDMFYRQWKNTEGQVGQVNDSNDAHIMRI